jgi:hypothetical protein
MLSKKVEKMLASQFNKDFTVPLNINGKQSSRGMYNLILSIRDVRLYKVGIKPHRNWRISDVKEYFGISGNTDSVIYQLEELKNVLMAEA